MKYLSLGILCVLVVNGCGESAKLTDYELVQKARSSREAGDLNASIIRLKNAIQQNPENAEARLLLGEVYLEAGDAISAEKELRRAKELGVTAPDLFIKLGETMLASGNFSEITGGFRDEWPAGMVARDQASLLGLVALAHIGSREAPQAKAVIDEALRLDAASPNALVGNAILAMAEQHQESAEEWLDRALVSDPEHARAWYVRGDLLRIGGDAQGAEDAYGNSIKFGSFTMEAQASRALVRAHLGKMDEARADARAVINKSPWYPGGYYALGSIEFKEQKFEESVAAFNEVLKRQPDHRFALLYAAISRYQLGHLERAEAHLGNYMRLQPRSVQGARLLARIRVQQKAYDEAVDLLRRAGVTPDEGSVEDRALLAKSLMGSGKVDEAVNILENLAGTAPESAGAQLSLGLGLMASGEEERGLVTLQDAASLAGSTGLPEYYLVIFNLQRGNHAEALDAVEQFAKKHPENATAYNMRGAIYLDMGEEGKAIAEFEKALDLSPGQRSASHNLAMLAMKNGDLKRAHELYATAWKHNPEHPRTAFYFANAKERLFGVNAAREFLEQVPDSVAATQVVRLKLAELYLSEGNFDKAQSLASMPSADGGEDHPAQLLLQARVKVLQNSPADALAIIDRVIDGNPRHANAYFLRGLAHLQLNQNKEALAALEIAHALDRLDPRTAALLARAMTLTGDAKKAREFLDKLPDASQKSPDVLVQRGWIALTQEEFERAEGYYREIPEKSRPPQADTGLATAMLRQRDLAGAVAVLKDAQTRHPRDHDIRRMLGNMYILNAEQDKARQVFSAMVEDGVRDPAVWNNLAWLLMENNPKQALEYSTLAYEAMPRARSIVDTHVQVLLANRQFGGAERVLNELMVHDPHYLNGRLQLAKVMDQQGRTGEAVTLLRETRLMQGTDADKARVDRLLEQLGTR